MTDTTAPHGALLPTPVFAAPMTNPFGLAGAGNGNSVSPSLVDIDGDGDLDAFMGRSDGATVLYLNTGTASNPAFGAAIAHPYGLSDMDIVASPTLVDMDGDGDLDAFVGDFYGDTHLFLNTGTATSPAFAAPTTNPYGLADVGSLGNASFADIDGDGDLDAFIGEWQGNTVVQLNTGTNNSPAFAAPVTNPYGLGDVGFNASPGLIDIDGDGDLDAFIGNDAGNTLLYINTGTSSSPAFAAAITNPFGLGDVGKMASPRLVDIDGDGDLDAVIGNYAGNTVVFINTASPVAPVASTTANGAYKAGSVITLTVAFNENVIVNTSGGKPTLALETGVIDRFASYVSGSGTSTLTFSYTVQAGDTSADLDYKSASALALNGGTIQDAAGNNAVLTLAAPGAAGSLGASAALVIDTSAPHGSFLPKPVFAAPVTNPFGLGNVGYYANPSFVDIDNDGDLDAVIGKYDINSTGNTLVSLNTGTASSPAFAAATVNPYGLGFAGGGITSPSFADIDGDGDLDAFIGNAYGNTLVYLNTGTAGSPAFAAAITNPYGLKDVGVDAIPKFADIDGDGDLDAFIGEGYGNTVVFLNTGTASNPAFGKAVINRYGLGDVGDYAAPSLVDIDADGDLDALIGNGFGNTVLYLNTGTASKPAFAAPTTNPYGLTDVGGFASPSFVDIDGDGDLDALVGNAEGNTVVFINTAGPVAPVTSALANGTYHVGSVITLTVSFNENVFVNTSGGKPTMALETGAIDRFATYAGGSGSHTLTFSYTVKAGDTSADLDYISSSALALNGGTIQDAAGNNAVLTLAAPGAAGSLAANKALVVDGINDIINGTSGADNLDGGVGADTMTGGQGDDRYYVDNTGDKVVETDATAAGGTDTVYSSLSTYTLTANVERGVIKTSGAASMTGNELNNQLYGGDGDNTLSGLNGDDYLNGGAGKDKLVGGLGADTMVGGDGNDAYYLENAADVVSETQANAAVGGIDTVYSYLAAYTLGKNVERGVINTSGVANMTGNELDNSLYGNADANKLTGAAGNDYLSGGAGNDTLSGGAGIDKLLGGTGDDRMTGGLDADVFLVDTGGGHDVITDFSFLEGDKISLRSNLNNSGITDGASALAQMHDVSGNAVLDMGSGDMMVLVGVHTAELTAADFLFF